VRQIDSVEAARIGLVNRTMESPERLRDFVDGLATRIATFPRGGIEATKAGVREYLSGQGSMTKDMQRLGELAQTAEAQQAISRLIELGRGDRGREFELGLPDSGESLWR
jgi:enoyl-CoA hydratase/carnithine racemase